MNKEQYLQKLRECLGGLPAKDADEIMQYYTEYFEDAGPEHEAAVIEELGDPAVLAAQAMEALGQTQGIVRNTSRPLLPSLLGLLKGRGAARLPFSGNGSGAFPQRFRPCPQLPHFH